MRTTGLGFLLFLGLTACSEDITGINISLAPDPNLNTYKQIAAQVTTVRFVFDSPTPGLYPAGTHERREGDLELKNDDEDPEIELVTEVPLLGDRLPTIRLEQGALSDIPINARIEGRDEAGTVRAYGQFDVPDFEAGSIKDVEPPQFNLLPKYSAPQVRSVWPDDKTQTGPIEVIHISFSKKMDDGSLSERDPPTIQLFRIEGAREIGINPKEGGIILKPADSPNPNIWVAQYHVNEPLAVGSYRVDISSNAMDSEGRRIDQVPTKDGAEGKSTHFKIGDGTGAQTATSCPNGEPSCDPLLTCGNTDSCSKGLICINDVCLPEHCPESCPEVTVCHPELHLCVADCRPYGPYGCSDSTTCGKDGICQ